MQIYSRFLIENARKLIDYSFKRKVVIFLLFSVVLVMLWAVYRERDALRSFHWQFNPQYLLLASLFHILSLGTIIINWHLMIRHFSGIARWRDDYFVCVISLAARRIPTPIWFIGSRMVLYPKGSVSPEIIGLTTGFEFGLIGLAGIATCFTLLPYFSFSERLPWPIVLALLLVSLYFIFIKPNSLIRLFNWGLRKLNRPEIDKGVDRKSLFAWFLMYVATWLFDGISVYYTIAMLTKDVPGFFDVMGAATASSFAGYIMQFFPFSFGMKEITLSALLGLWIPISVGIVASLASRVLMTLVEVGWALLVKKPLNKALEKNNTKVL